MTHFTFRTDPAFLGILSHKPLAIFHNYRWR